VHLTALAAHLGVQVRQADTLVDRAALLELERIQPGCFNAATFHLPDGRVVAVLNPVASSAARQKSDLAHELAHILLKHDVRQVHQIGTFTFFDCDPEQEAEANWLAGCLLLPRPLLLQAVRRGMTAADLAAHEGVSPEMAAFRLNASGVHFQAGVRRRAASSGA
jgi:hypothetical protein